MSTSLSGVETPGYYRASYGRWQYRGSQIGV